MVRPRPYPRSPRVLVRLAVRGLKAGVAVALLLDGDPYHSLGYPRAPPRNEQKRQPQRKRSQY